MGIETERLELRPLTKNGADRSVAQSASALEIPAEFSVFYSQIQQGFSLAQIAMSLKASAQAGRFKSLARFLVFLADHNLLVDPRAYQLAENLRGDYRWPTNPIFTPLFSLKLFEIARRRQSSTVRGVVLASSLLIGSLGCVALFKSMILPFQWSATQSGWPWIASLFVMFSLSRSIRALTQSIAMHLTSLYPFRLAVQIDATGIAFVSDDLSLAAGGELTLWTGIAAILTMGAPLWLFRQSSWLPAARYYVFLLFLLELSPFVKSGFTDALRAFYNLMLAPSRQDERLDALMQRVHLVASGLWIFLSVGFLVFALKPAVFWTLRTLDFSSSERTFETLLPFAIFAAAQLAILCSVAGDVAQAFTSGGILDFASGAGGPAGRRGELRKLRRLWRRKPRSFTAQAAIAQGRLPGRGELAKLPLLRQLDTTLRDELLAKAKVIELKEGESACRQGDRDRSLFILLTGEVAVARQIRGRRRVVALLRDGAIFGEAAFFLGQARTADVVAMRHSFLLEIDHQLGMRSLDQDRSEELQTRIWFLQALTSASLFRDIPSEALDALIFAGRERRLPVGSFVTREGQDGEACYFLIQGGATVTQNGRVINKMKAGDVFGEIALLRPILPRTASVVADSDLMTIAVSSEDFWDLLSNHLPLAIEIERIADARLEADRKRNL